MIFAIRLTEEHEDVFNDLYLDKNDITSILAKHAKLYADNPRVAYLPPSVRSQSDPLGQRGYLIWQSELGHFEKQEYQDWVYAYGTDPIFSRPLNLKDTFDYKSLGLEKLIDESINKDYYNN